MKTIAIIPAKGASERLPRKNVRKFCGLELFLHSAYYARQEGVEPVVSTDSPEVQRLCGLHGVRWVPEVVDEKKMANCVRQVLDQVSCDAYALLLPTSPLRVPGLLRRMEMALESGVCESAYSSLRIKPIGRLGSDFMQAYRDQDAARHFEFFDGNISIATRAHFERTGEVLAADSGPVGNTYPCNLQIDTATEWEMLSHLADHAAFAQFLPTRPGQRICVVSNAPESERDWSSTIDEMDEVWRVNKLENIDKGWSGSRCDVAVLTVGPIYRTFSPEEQHLAALKEAGKIWLFRPRAAEGRAWMRHIGHTNWALLPEALHARCKGYTTLGLAVAQALYTHPKAQLFLCGDLSAATRTRGHRIHSSSGETDWLHHLISTHTLTLLPTS